MDDYELIGGTTSYPESNAVTTQGDIEFILRPFPPSNSQASIQTHWKEKWERIWNTFYGWDVLDYLEILKLLPYPLLTQWLDRSEHILLLHPMKYFYEDGVYPWLNSWFTLQGQLTGKPVQVYKDEARRIKIRFELAEIMFEHPQIELSWNSLNSEWNLFSSPGHIGFWSEIARCRELLINKNLVKFSGVVRQPCRRGKKETTIKMRKPSQSRQPVNGCTDLLQNLHRVIEGTAQELISNRKLFGNFDGRDRVISLLKEIDEIKLRQAQLFDSSENYQLSWVEDDGSIFITSKNYNLPKPSKRKRKG